MEHNYASDYRGNYQDLGENEERRVLEQRHAQLGSEMRDLLNMERDIILALPLDKSALNTAHSREDEILAELRKLENKLHDLDTKGH